MHVLQVALIKADLDSYIMSNSGCSADNTTVLSPECSPNPAEKSPAGVPFSQYNATRETHTYTDLEHIQYIHTYIHTYTYSYM